MKALFQDCIQQIEQEMLGENKSADYVTKDLNLMTELPEKPVEIEWRLKSYDVLNLYGEIQEEGLKESGTPVRLEALITYVESPERQVLHECMVVVYPPKVSKEEQFFQGLEKEIENRDKRLVDSTRIGKYISTDQAKDIRLSSLSPSPH
jgi:hypothetical protein